MVTPSTCIAEVPSSNLSRQPVIETEDFRALQTNDGTVSRTGPQSLPSVYSLDSDNTFLSHAFQYIFQTVRRISNRLYLDE